MRVFVENAGIVRVSVIDTEYSMSPARLDDSVSLAEEYLLCLKLIELFELCLDILKLLSSLPWHSYFPRVDHELCLCILEISNLLVDLLNVLLPFGLVKQRLLLAHLLHGGYPISLLQGRGPIVLIYVDLLRHVFSVH